MIGADGQGGGDAIAVRLRVTGRGLGAGYARFAAARLARLGLDGSAGAEAERATILARGPAALVEMLEIACLLGPADCLVDHIAVETLEASGAPGSERAPTALPVDIADP